MLSGQGQPSSLLSELESVDAHVGQLQVQTDRLLRHLGSDGISTLPADAGVELIRRDLGAIGKGISLDRLFVIPRQQLRAHMGIGAGRLDVELEVMTRNPQGPRTEMTTPGTRLDADNAVRLKTTRLTRLAVFFRSSALKSTLEPP